MTTEAATVRDRIKSLRRVRASDLIPHPKNWRRHPAGQAAAMRAALSEIGFADALLVRETKRGLQIIDGHLRAELSPDQKVPCLVLDVTAKEADKLLATFDPITGMAETDIEQLSALAGTLDFDVPELADLVAATLGESGGADQITEDEAPAPQDGPCVAQVGDVWACGRHRVLCGDATDEADVAAVLRGERADMAFTDPPWNVGIGTDKNPRHRQRQGLVNDSMPEADFGSMLAAFAVALAKFVEGDVYCVLGSERWPLLDKTLRDAGFHWSATIIWVKDIFGLGRSKYHRGYEPIWYVWTTSSSFCADRKQDDVWEFARPKRSPEHPTMKPVQLVARAISNSSARRNTVLDPFLGSGTTLIAAEQLGRTCYGIEIEPRYVDVILRRYMNFTNVSPVRESDGALFSDLVTAEAVPA